MKCDHKHTCYQPSDEEWKCPRCGSKDKFAIEESAAGEDARLLECHLLHDEDTMLCFSCGYRTTGKDFAEALVRENNLVSCPTCEGKGCVSKEAAQMEATSKSNLGILTKALFDLTDGESAHDIQYNTGLPIERCEEIVAIKNACYKAIKNGLPLGALSDIKK